MVPAGLCPIGQLSQGPAWPIHPLSPSALLPENSGPAPHTVGLAAPLTLHLWGLLGSKLLPVPEGCTIL